MYSIGKAAQVAREMGRTKCDILGLSEIRWTGFGRTELNTGKSIIFSGREDNIHRSGMAIMMSPRAKRALLEWRPISERIITARFDSKYVKISMVQTYAPTEDSSDEDKDANYEMLQTVVSESPKHDIKIITGDLNAKVGSTNTGVKEIMGIHGMAIRNNNGERLVSFCDFNNLVITGTVFPHQEIHKATWKSPDGRTRNQIDHILISRQHRTTVLDTKVLREADIASDHYLVRTKLRIKLKRINAAQNPTK